MGSFSKRKILIGGGVLFLLVAFLYLFLQTGFLRKDQIDLKDAAYWKYDYRGIIPEAHSMELRGASGECWVMAHGYTSTPDELRKVAEAVHARFDDTVFVPRLLGHGTLPSDIEKYSVEDWYGQIRDLAQVNKCNYLLGSSLGAALVLRYAEEYSPKGIVLAGAYIDAESFLLPMDLVTKGFYRAGRFLRRSAPTGTITDPEGRKAHITHWVFPLKAVVEFNSSFKEKVKTDASKIQSSVLFLHAAKDSVGSISSVRKIFEKIEGKKEFVELQGEHVVFRDIDREAAIQNTLRFRAENR